MKDPKNNQVVDNNSEELKQIRAALGITDGSKTATAGQAMVKGDKFMITGVTKVQGSESDDFIPLVFTTNIGKSIGTKNFNSVDYADDEVEYPRVGRTVDEAIRFMMWARDNEVVFKVKKIDVGEEKEGTRSDGKPYKYTPKDIKLVEATD